MYICDNNNNSNCKPLTGRRWKVKGGACLQRQPKDEQMDTGVLSLAHQHLSSAGQHQHTNNKSIADGSGSFHFLNT